MGRHRRAWCDHDPAIRHQCDLRRHRQAPALPAHPRPESWRRGVTTKGDSNMMLFRTVLLTSGLVLAFCSAADAREAAAGGKMVTLQMPATPEPARVTLDPKTTALMVLDYVEDICNSQPSCKTKMLPAVTPFMQRVRKAGLTVAYGTRAQNMTKWLPQVAPAPGDIKIVNTGQDRFFGTDLDKELKAKGIKTIIMVGW